MRRIWLFSASVSSITLFKKLKYKQIQVNKMMSCNSSQVIINAHNCHTITVLHTIRNSSFQFCCLARQQIKPFVTAKDFSEIVAAAKRLNIDLNGKGKSFVPMVANADPKHVEKAVEKIKEVEKELVNVEDTKEKTKIQGVQLKSVFIRLL